MKHKISIHALIFCCIFLINCSGALAAVKLPAIFGDNMILQRDINVPIWGWASPNGKVSIKFQGKTFNGIAGTDGKWQIKLDSYKAGGPYQMAIIGDGGQINLKNILIGEVWVNAGQSNMEFGIITEAHFKDAIGQANDKQIHLFVVPVTTALEPQDDIAPVPVDTPNGKWIVLSPDVLKDRKLAHNGFSAVGFYFALQIRKATGAPVGMIGAYLGGTPAQSWTSIDALQQHPDFSKYITAHQQFAAQYQQNKSAYIQQMSQYKAVMNQPVASGAKPKKPLPPDGGNSAPGNLYNGMISPIAGYGIKGVAFYQGEANGNKLADAVEYKELFPTLIQDWRNKWGQGDFPFVFVQIANYHAEATTPSAGAWPWVREAQYLALSLPATAMAVTTDLGEANNLHYKNKLDAGVRLALAARHAAYGENIVFSGPVYKSMRVDGNKIILTMDGYALFNNRTGQSGNDLKGFGIAGADQKFVWAKAVITGDTIEISADGVTQPVAVRYNWDDNPPGNLYNKEGLPASSFRTDNWPPPLRTQDK